MASFKQYRAPAGNDSALVDPPWSEQLARIASPARPANITIGGTPLKRLAASAREDVLKAAQAYTSAYADVSTPTGPLVVSGHQPELFHPGVWFKNFALDSLAKAAGGVGLHLLIDSDLCRETSIRVPTGSVEAPRVEAIDYDTPAATMPHEQREIRDAELLGSFADRVIKKTLSPSGDPLVGQLWEQAAGASREDMNLGRMLSKARHRLERAWGSKTLELPFSQVADDEGFRRFAAELLQRAGETANAYNEALATYRDAHRLRNAAQPLPDLAADGSWIETPFWVWSDAEPTRRPLVARVETRSLTLTDRQGWTATGPADADGVVAWLTDLRADGIKIRSRALATTLYCRLVLADLFLHGIGGAKYDQVTDLLGERLFGTAPPPYATLTATLRLPIEHNTPTEQDRLAAVKRLRDLDYHPEWFVEDHPAAQEKQRLIREANTATNTAAWHQAIQRANEALRETVHDRRVQAERILEETKLGLRRAAILDSREYSFCLFPAADVRDRLTKLSTIDTDA